MAKETDIFGEKKTVIEVIFSLSRRSFLLQDGFLL